MNKGKMIEVLLIGLQLLELEQYADDDYIEYIPEEWDKKWETVRKTLNGFNYNYVSDLFKSVNANFR